jgi:hypothetical protein
MEESKAGVCQPGPFDNETLALQLGIHCSFLPGIETLLKIKTVTGHCL